MSWALVRKTLRDSLPLMVVLVAASALFEILVVIFVREVLQDVLKEMAPLWMQRGPIRELMGSMLGADLASDLSSTSFMTIGFSHPILYALMWALLLTIATRTTVGEVDRGTADVLLTLPITRTAVYMSVSAAWMLAAVLVSLAPLGGTWLGQLLNPLRDPLNLRRLAMLVVNLLVLNLAIGGVTMLVSSLLARRGRAVGVVLAILEIALLIQFLAPFWRPAQRVAFLSLLHYYLPLATVRSGAWPVGDLVTLVSIAVVTWLAGLWCFARRDIPAV